MDEIPRIQNLNSKITEIFKFVWFPHILVTRDPGIDKWPLNSCSYPMMIHKITSRLQLWVNCGDTQLNKPTNQNSIKVPKVVKPANREHFFETSGTSVINSPSSPSSICNKDNYIHK